MSHLSIGTAWDEARAIYAREKRLIVPLALSFILLPLAVVGLVSGGERKVQASDLPAAQPLVVAVMVLAVMIGNIAVARLALSRGESVGEALRVGSRRVWAALGAGVIVGLPIVLAGVTILVASGVDPAVLEKGDLSGVGSLFLSLLLLLLLALIYVGVRMTPLNVLAASQEGGPVTLLRRAFALTRGHFWKLLGFVLLIGVAMSIVGMVVAMIVGAAIAMTGGGVEPMSLGALLLGLANGLVNTVASVLTLLMIVSIVRQLSAGENSVPHVHPLGH